MKAVERIRAQTVKKLAGECGFELCGIAGAGPLAEYRYYRDWAAAGMAGGMTYLTDRRGNFASP